MEKNLNHNITFSLGDPSGDGHGIYDTYHIVCNYSAEEIQEAYREVVKDLDGWDFLYECSEYENRCISGDGVKNLLQLGVISSNDPCLEENVHEEGEILYYVESPDVYIDLYFKLVKLQLKDLEWDYRDLEEEYLAQLDYTGYGLYD